MRNDENILFLNVDCMKKSNPANIDETIKKLEAIAEWFDSRNEPDLEQGLLKVEEAARLLSVGRERLAEIENRFEAVKKMVGRGEL